MRGDRFGRRMDSPEFATLQSEWYDKLEAVGFQDIEPRPERLLVNSYLKGHYIEARKRAVRGVMTGKAELFRLAERWIDIHRWGRRIDRWAWACWMSGWDCHEIVVRRPELGLQRALGGRIRTVTRYMLAFFRAENAAEQAAAEVEGA